MTVEVFGHRFERDIAEAIVEAMLDGRVVCDGGVEAIVEAFIDALDHQDGDADGEAETEEDDQRKLQEAA